jgi:transcriptional regulator with XRE-family HTH domain
MARRQKNEATVQVRDEGGAVAPEAAFGKRLRLRRQELGLTLEEAAQRSGLGRSFISEIERDMVSPSIASLLKLCRALDLGLRDLFDERPSTLIRRAERRRVGLGGHGFSDFALTPRNSRRMLATWTELAPGAYAGQDFYSLEAEEELILVLEGELVVRFEDEPEEIIMESGDALTLDPRKRRMIGNHLKDRKTIAVLVYTPPPS